MSTCLEELEIKSASLAMEDIEGTGTFLNHSNSYAANTLGCRPFLVYGEDEEAADAKAEAFKHLVASRVRWLTSFGDGTDELFSEFDSSKFGLYVGDFIAAAHTPGKERKAEVGALFAEAILFEAQRLAHNWALGIIEEVWANRHSPDYTPPWEDVGGC